jgi:dTDP-N-acetylfucosamine:lipid II N-acetylfucosaminyltransferase
MSNKILHIMHMQKFLPPFIDFVSNNFDEKNHTFFFLDSEKKYEYGLTSSHKVQWLENKKQNIELIKQMYKADKIILHSIWKKKIIMLLFFQPWLLKKCYHVMWGGDFNSKRAKYDLFKRFVIKYMGCFVTYIKGDYEYVKKYFNAKGKYVECLMYKSNLFQEINISEKTSNTINIQVGNSAVARNKHLEVFEMLKKYKDEDIKIFVPLGYGSKENAQKIIQKGYEIFGDKFIPLEEFMPFDKYIEFLSQIDMAIFANDNQQAMGNIVSLAGLGKKVYIKKSTTTWSFFRNKEIKLFNIDSLNINLIDNELRDENILKIKEYFSEETLNKQLESLF